MSDTRLDIEMQLRLKERAAIKEARRDYCYRDCDGHNENCPYYDEHEDCWDFENCFKDRGGF